MAVTRWLVGFRMRGLAHHHNVTTTCHVMNQRRSMQTTNALAYWHSRRAYRLHRKQGSRRPQTLPPLLPPGWKVTLSARKVVPCERWPATGITVHSL